jgi:hypothetical protein
MLEALSTYEHNAMEPLLLDIQDLLCLFISVSQVCFVHVTLQVGLVKQQKTLKSFENKPSYSALNQNETLERNMDFLLRSEFCLLFFFRNL